MSNEAQLRMERDTAELRLGRLREALGNGEAEASYLTDYDRQMIQAFSRSEWKRLMESKEGTHAQ